MNKGQLIDVLGEESGFSKAESKKALVSPSQEIKDIVNGKKS